jgi:radical SAM/Cys-rich protein
MLSHQELPVHSTLPLLKGIQFQAVKRACLETLQVNLGYRCNQSCVHCHVDAGPRRTEEMPRETVDTVLAFLASQRLRHLDLTGGAPELNPHFRYLVEHASKTGVRITDRCNLTILEELGQEDLAEFLASNRISIVASLPCYLEVNVDRQRGNGVFAASVRGLRRLNELGFGREGTGLLLDLVFNPQGPVLPPPQKELESAYKQELRARFGIEFNNLFTLVNMPIRRFGSLLVSNGQFDSYMALLQGAHADANLTKVMCRTLLSVDWQGHVYDCDFNQMLDIPFVLDGRKRLHLSDLLNADFAELPIQVAGHCFGCSEGQGSSCQGALNTPDLIQSTNTTPQ